MYIRCLVCRGVTWVESDCRQQCVVACSNCCHPLRLRNVTTQDSHNRFEDAVCFAEASKIDLPSANSVLLGIMSLREALSIQGRSIPVPTGSPSPMEIAADEALRTLEQERTQRALALAAKNQPSLPEKHPRAALFAALGMFLAAIALSVLGWNFWATEIASARALEDRNREPTQLASSDDQPVTRVDRTVRLRRNGEDQVVQIIGRTPGDVLRRFCAVSGEPGQYEPVELATTNPHRIGARVGIVRNFQDLSQSYAIWIQQRRRDRRWIAGTGEEPLKPFMLDYDRVGDIRVEITKDTTNPSG